MRYKTHKRLDVLLTSCCFGCLKAVKTPLSRRRLFWRGGCGRSEEKVSSVAVGTQIVITPSLMFCTNLTYFSAIGRRREAKNQANVECKAHNSSPRFCLLPAIRFYSKFSFQFVDVWVAAASGRQRRPGSGAPHAGK